MVRLVAGVVLGYALFVFTAVLVFQIPGRDPHAAADPAFMVGSIGAAAIAAFVAGYVGAAVARGFERTAGIVIAVIIAGGALISFIAQPGPGARWSQLSGLLVMAPTALLGSLIRARRLRAAVR
jgi:hypothetical protein